MNRWIRMFSLAPSGCVLSSPDLSYPLTCLLVLVCCHILTVQSEVEDEWRVEGLTF